MGGVAISLPLFPVKCDDMSVDVQQLHVGNTRRSFIIIDAIYIQYEIIHPSSHCISIAVVFPIIMHVDVHHLYYEKAGGKPTPDALIP